jgi:hypothetical protein
MPHTCQGKDRERVISEVRLNHKNLNWKSTKFSILKARPLVLIQVITLQRTKYTCHGWKTPALSFVSTHTCSNSLFHVIHPLYSRGRAFVFSRFILRNREPRAPFGPFHFKSTYNLDSSDSLVESPSSLFKTRLTWYFLEKSWRSGHFITLMTILAVSRKQLPSACKIEI